jgi:para-nitrobenzyl esterase
MTAEVNTRRADSGAVVDTGYGPVRGIDDGNIKVWKGIRYAAPPIDELRWRAPVPPRPWREVADATRFGAISPQPVHPALPMGPGAYSDEDCLFLNVWTASTVEPGDAKPVMVWLHGGGYLYGSSSQPLYDGRVLVSSGDVVVVTVNYRLGGLGFLDLSSFSTPNMRFDTNLALRDVLLALHWVRDNIAGFGGDLDRVTVFGESAGAGLVTALLAAPAAAGLFVRAIAQSSPATSVYDGSRARRVAELMMDALAAAGPDEMRDVPVEAIIDASFHAFDAVPTQTPGTLAFAPTVDGDVLPDYPVKAAREGRTHPVPLIIGTNKDEAALFKLIKSPLMPITPEAIRTMFAEIAREQPGLQLPSEAEIRLAYAGLRVKARGLGVARDVGFRMPTLWLGEGHSAVAPVYLYRFDWATPVLNLLRIGATHATELPYVWGNLVAGPRDVTFKLGGLKQGRAVSRRLQARWRNFAGGAEPAGAGGDPVWRAYRGVDRATLVIDKDDRVVDDLDRELRATWGDEVLGFL